MERLIAKMGINFKNGPTPYRGAVPNPAKRRRHAFSALAFLAVLAVGLLFLLPGGLLQAQEGLTTVYHAENDEGPVTTLSARDPEGVTPPMVWSLVTDAAVSEEIETADIADAADFEISDAGVLTFATGAADTDEDPPNYEVPTDEGQNNEYKVVVQASDGGKTDKLSYFKVVVRVTDEDEPGKVTWTVDPDGDDTEEDPQMLRQFQNGATLTASVTDPDGDVGQTVTVTDFDIATVTWKWYRGSDMSGPWTMIDEGTSASYDVASPADVDKHLRVVASYTDRKGSGKSRELVSTHPVKEALANNKSPAFSPARVTRTVAENAAKGMNIGARVMATDADDTVLTYMLGGNDVGKFDIDPATGQLMAKTMLNYEANAGTDDNCTAKNACSVEVTATDPSGADTAPVATVTITVTNENDKPTFAGVDGTASPPENTQGMAADHREETDSLTIAQYTATDPEGASVTLSLSGDDKDMFMLGSDTDADAGAIQELSLKMKPDFEMPGDRNKDNIYEVTVIASDGTMEAMRPVTVKVTDADEMGEVTLSTQDARTGVPITATLKDSDGGVTGEKWTWHRLDSATAEPVFDDPSTPADEGTDIDMATSATYTPVVDDEDKFLKAMASYVDRTYDEDNDDTNNDAADGFEGFMNTATSMATTAVRDDPANKAPEFKDAAAQRFVMENTAVDMDIGMPVTAKENDAGQTLTYTLGGTDKDSFKIVQADVDANTVGGQLMTKAELDYEKKKTYKVTVKATDSSGESNDSDTITVTITVTDMDEGPEITGPTTTVNHAENDDGAVTTLSAKDPEGVTPPMVWSLVTDAAVSEEIETADIADAADFEISDAGVLTFATGAADTDEDPPNYEVPTDEGQNNEYKVVVQASDGGKTDKLSYFKVVVGVTDEDEPGKVTWTVDPDGDDTEEDPQMLRQFQNGATLTASVTDPDGDVGQTVTVTDFDIATVTWKWYRGSAVIDGAIGASYTVTGDDVTNRLKVVASYTDRRGSGKSRELVSTHPVKLGVAANKSPAFSPARVTRTLAENTAKGMDIGARVMATDADDTVLTYMLGGNDVGKFDIDPADGQLMTKTKLNYEANAGTDDNCVNKNACSVTVTATDPSGADAVATVTITVTNVNDKPMFTAGTEGMADDRPEDAALTVLVSTYTATDPEDGNVTLSLSGDDEDKFMLGSDTEPGVNVSQPLAFKAKPDFEMPGDRNKDNIYEVTVVASDGTMEAMRLVTVKVTDADEAGKVALSTQDARTGAPIKATLTDSDGGVTGEKWTWHRLDSATAEPVFDDPSTPADEGTDIDMATSDSYTPVFKDESMYLKAVASYVDRTYDEDNDDTNNDAADGFEGFMNMATSMATTAVRDDPANKAPEFKDTAAQRFVMENTAVDMDIGMPVTAKENDAGQTLTYTLGGTDKDSFKIVQADVDANTVGGQLMTKAELDYEEKKTYKVTVTATDSSGETNDSASIPVTIYVTDVDEKPVIMVVPTENQAPMFRTSSTTRSITEGPSSGRAIGSRVTATDPGDSLTYTLEGTDAASFSIDSGTGQLRTSAPLDRDTESTYTVTVRATDGAGLYDTITVTITVTEAGEQMGEVTLWAGTVALTMAPQVDDTITGAVMDLDGGVMVVSWQWSRTTDTADMSSWMPITGATDAAYTVTEGDTGYYLRVMATYTDAVGTDTATVYSPATMMVGAEAEDQLLAEYDPNSDGVIEKADMRKAVTKFFAVPAELSRSDMRRLVGIYFR